MWLSTIAPGRENEDRMKFECSCGFDFVQSRAIEVEPGL
jgi:hypothetical protein